MQVYIQESIRRDRSILTTTPNAVTACALLGYVVI